MVIQLRLAFRAEELAECKDVSSLRRHLEKHRTSPFWLDFDDSFAEVVRHRVPQVLERVQLARLKLRPAEQSQVRFFEVSPKLLVPVTDADFGEWDQMRGTFRFRASPDGYNVRVPDRLPLSKVRLAENEIGCPESGEFCFVANASTIDRIRAVGIQGLCSNAVVSSCTEEVAIIQAERVISASREILAFGCKSDANGCRIIDRPVVMAINAADALGDFDLALLPESRDSCAGTLVVGRRFVEACEKIGIVGIKFTPVLVIGDELWRGACEQWKAIRQNGG